MAKAKTYRTLAERRADAARSDALQLAHSITVIQRVERIRATLHGEVVSSVSCEVVDAIVRQATTEPNRKPISYGMWKSYLASLRTGYVQDTLGEVVQAYCVHCQQPFAVSEGQRIVIGTVVKYAQDEVEFDKYSMEWVEEERKTVRPATHAGIGCLACYLAYTKVDNTVRSYRYRVRYTYRKASPDTKPRVLYARDLNHAAELLSEVGFGGRTEILDCKRIPERRGFLDVRERAIEGLPVGAPRIVYGANYVTHATERVAVDGKDCVECGQTIIHADSDKYGLKQCSECHTEYQYGVDKQSGMKTLWRIQ